MSFDFRYSLDGPSKSVRQGACENFAHADIEIDSTLQVMAPAVVSCGDSCGYSWTLRPKMLQP